MSLLNRVLFYCKSLMCFTEVRVLVNEVKPAGLHGVKWNGLNEAELPVSSGLYLYRIVSQNQVVIKKMVLMR